MLSLALVLGLGLSLRTKSQSLVLALALNLQSLVLSLALSLESLVLALALKVWSLVLSLALRLQYKVLHYSASTLVPSTQWRLHYQHSVSSFLMSNNCLAMFCVRRRRPHLWNVFSQSGLLMRPNRARMSNALLETLVFLKCNISRL